MPRRCMYVCTCKRGATARRRQTVRVQEKAARRQRAPAPKKLVHVCVYVRSGTHAGETSSEVPDVWVAASDEALAIRAGMGHEGREFFASQPASKELACELPGSLGLGQSYVRPPKTLEGQENQTCSNCDTKRPPYVFLLTSCLHAKRHACM